MKFSPIVRTREVELSSMSVLLVTEMPFEATAAAAAAATGAMAVAAAAAEEEEEVKQPGET